MVLEPMVNLSEIVAEAARKPENARFQTGGVTAGEWFARRIKNQRVKNRKVNVDPPWACIGYSPRRKFRDLKHGRKAGERNTSCWPVEREARRLTGQTARPWTEPEKRRGLAHVRSTPVPTIEGGGQTVAQEKTSALIHVIVRVQGFKLL